MTLDNLGRRLRYVRTSMQIQAMFWLEGSEHHERVVKGLPKDAVFMRSFVCDDYSGDVGVVFAHPSWDVLNEGDRIPQLMVQYEQIQPLNSVEGDRIPQLMVQYEQIQPLNSVPMRASAQARAREGLCQRCNGVGLEPGPLDPPGERWCERCAGCGYEPKGGGA